MPTYATTFALPVGRQHMLSAKRSVDLNHLSEAIQKATKRFRAPGDRFGDKFNDLVRLVLRTLRPLELEGQAPTADENDNRRRTFSSWKHAQAYIASAIRERLLQEAAATRELKTSRRSTHRDPLIERSHAAKARTARHEINALRRLLDSVAWDLLNGEHSTIRRLVQKDGQHSLSVSSIDDAMPYVAKVNEDRDAMAICSDITTFIHVGDVLVYDASKQTLGFVELKKGAANIHIMRAVRAHIDGKWQGEATSTWSRKDQEHFARALKQAQRNQATVDTINTNEGTDASGARVSIKEIQSTLEAFSQQVRQCWDELQCGKKWAIECIDDCLYVGVYRDEALAPAVFAGWLESQGCRSEILNLCDSFLYGTARPLASLPLPGRLLDELWTGKTRVLMSLDAKRFVDFFNRMHPGSLVTLSASETRRIRAKLGPGELFLVDGGAVRTTAAGSKSYLGAGLVDRICFDLHTPASVAEFWAEGFLNSTEENDGA